MHINNVKFANNKQELKGKLDLSKLERIQDLGNYTGILDFELKGYIDKLNRPTLSLYVCGIICTSCQNCLQPMNVSIDNQTEITVFYTEDQLDASLFEDKISGVSDGVLAEEEFSVMQLVEDEVIMLIPCASKHESCIGLSYTDDVESPFKILKKLI